MKKTFITVMILITTLLMMCSFASYAAGYSYTLDNLTVASESISVSVKNESDAEMSATVYIAIYDEYHALLNVKSQAIEIAEGESTTVTKEFSTNNAVTAKAFVRKGTFESCGKYVYKTIFNEGDIEFGGDI